MQHNLKNAVFLVFYAFINYFAILLTKHSKH